MSTLSGAVARMVYRVSMAINTEIQSGVSSSEDSVIGSFYKSTQEAIEARKASEREGKFIAGYDDQLKAQWVRGSNHQPGTVAQVDQFSKKYVEVPLLEMASAALKTIDFFAARANELVSIAANYSTAAQVGRGLNDLHAANAAVKKPADDIQLVIDEGTDFVVVIHGNVSGMSGNNRTVTAQLSEIVVQLPLKAQIEALQATLKSKLEDLERERSENTTNAETIANLQLEVQSLFTQMEALEGSFKLTTSSKVPHVNQP